MLWKKEQGCGDKGVRSDPPSLPSVFRGLRHITQPLWTGFYTGQARVMTHGVVAQIKCGTSATWWDVLQGKRCSFPAVALLRQVGFL